MPRIKWEVELRETVIYTMIVERDEGDGIEMADPSDIGDEAVDTWCDSADPTTEFNGEGQGVEVTDVKRIEP